MTPGEQGKGLDEGLDEACWGLCHGASYVLGEDDGVCKVNDTIYHTPNERICEEEGSGLCEHSSCIMEGERSP